MFIHKTTLYIKLLHMCMYIRLKQDLHPHTTCIGIKDARENQYTYDCMRKTFDNKKVIGYVHGDFCNSCATKQRIV